MKRLRELFTETKITEATYCGSGTIGISYPVDSKPPKTLIDVGFNLLLGLPRLPRYFHVFKTNEGFLHLSRNKISNKDSLTPGKKVKFKRTYLTFFGKKKEIDKRIIC